MRQNNMMKNNFLFQNVKLYLFQASQAIIVISVVISRDMKLYLLIFNNVSIYLITFFYKGQSLRLNFTSEDWILEFFSGKEILNITHTKV